jgi:hypothetical protein
MKGKTRKVGRGSEPRMEKRKDETCVEGKAI